MSIKNASSKTLIEDLKVSFKFATKNIINFLLAMVGVALVSALLLAAIAAVVIPLIFVMGGFDFFLQNIIVWITTYETLPFVTIILTLLIVLSPLLGPFLVAFGALYGMGREIVESEGTTAEGVFSWYSKKFLSLGGGGLIQFFIIIIPIVTIAAILTPFGLTTGFGPEQLGLASAVLGILLVYLGFMSGLLSMVFPAIIDGHSVIDSLRISLRLSTKYFDRVFANWFAYLGIMGLVLLPLVLPPLLFFPAGTFLLTWLAPYGAFASLFTILILLPAMVIGMSRIYMILIAENVTEQKELHDEEFSDSTSDDVSIFGGN